MKQFVLFAVGSILVQVACKLAFPHLPDWKQFAIGMCLLGAMVAYCWAWSDEDK